MFDMIIKGGTIMYPIILCSIIALAIVVERVFHLYRANIDTKKFMDEIANKLRRNKIMESIEMCENTPGPIAHILKAGILKHDRPKEEIKETIEEAGLYEVPRLEKNLPVLSTIAHITPLLGLLGTVLGMVRCFQVIQEKSASLYPVSPGDLAGGIWQALITTVVGLSIAIPTYVAYNYLVNKVDGFVLDMERSATDLINILTQRGSDLR
ncbi:MAG: MotA/TolQ/ExbB proton channel family protein [Candidatus Omnitrophota bacterium]|nr:MAG: MotA/TolQ/ExbB proton channel family protein [Candidatus Omnitrophota bacterium]